MTASSDTLASRRRRRTRIIATVGPASADKAMLRELWKAGVNVFRLNMSHGDHKTKAGIVRDIRALERELGRPIAIMADLQGPKIRIGEFDGGSATLARGERFRLDLEEGIGDTTRVHLPHPEVLEVLESGMPVLIDDGRVRLRVIEREATSVLTEIEAGGTISDHKGLNLPGAVLPMGALTEKDLRDLEFALHQGVDWIALSFVQRPDDVAEARKLVGGRAGVLAKIEKPSAVERIEEIVEFADAVMVARGDLGVELPVEDVPGAQRRIVRAARESGRPVVVATQMLESMIHSPMPTRAEVSDVATAIHDGADAVMLSAESAVGEYPREAVEVMCRVALKEESDPAYSEGASARVSPHATAEDAISVAARQVAETVNAKAIVTFTNSGSTALRAARQRPHVPILVLTPRAEVARRLCLVWGLYTVETEDVANFEEMYTKAKRMALEHGLARPGDRIAVTAGVPFGTPGATNVLHLAWIGEKDRRGGYDGGR